MRNIPHHQTRTPSSTMMPGSCICHWARYLFTWRAPLPNAFPSSWERCSLPASQFHACMHSRILARRSQPLAHSQPFLTSAETHYPPASAPQASMLWAGTRQLCSEQRLGYNTQKQQMHSKNRHPAAEHNTVHSRYLLHCFVTNQLEQTPLP